MLTTKQREAADVATPADGHATLFVDDADTPRVKLSDGTSPAVGGGVEGATPRAWAVVQLGAGTEAILSQVGDVFTGINVVGTGVYELELDPAAGIDTESRLGVQVSATGTNLAGQERFCSYFAELASDKITLYVFNAAGTAVAASRATMTIWYAPEVP